MDKQIKNELNASHPLFFSDNRLLENWDTFIQKRKLLRQVDPHIAASWQRCIAFLNPFEIRIPSRLDPGMLLATQAANFNMISVARPILEDIFQYLEETDSAVILINNACYILEILGDASILNKLAAFSLARKYPNRKLGPRRLRYPFQNVLPCL